MMNFGRSCFNSNSNGIRSLHCNWHSFRRLLYSTSSMEGNTNDNACSLIANYLVNSLGFSNHQSLSTSAKLLKSRPHLGTDVKVNNSVDNFVAVVHFFKQLGFQDSHIRRVVSQHPRLLTSKVDKTLRPKIKLLLDLGFSGSELVLAISRNPYILTQMSQNLVPAISAFRVVLGSDDNVLKVFMQLRWKFAPRVGKFLIPNVELLQNEYGIPRDKIQKHMLRDAKPYIGKTDRFRDKLVKVEEKFGIPRDSVNFLYGLRVVDSFSEKNIEKKFKIFMSFGWTQCDVSALMRRNPMCLALGEARIRENLDFLMNQVGYKPDFLASMPNLLTCSVKKRLLPRHTILQVLKDKGLLRRDYSLGTAAAYIDARFLKRFVLPFEEVHQVYAQLTGSTVESLNLGVEG